MDLEPKVKQAKEQAKKILSGADWGIHKDGKKANLGGAKSKIDSSSSKSDEKGLEMASKPAPYVIWVGSYTNPNEADPHGVPHDSRHRSRCPLCRRGLTCACGIAALSEPVFTASASTRTANSSRLGNLWT